MVRFLKKFISVALASMVIFSGCTQNTTANANASGNVEVHFLNVGQADCSLIKFPDGSNMLIDAGNNGDSQYITEYLANEGVKKLDVVVGTHPHEDHIGSLDTVINNFDIGAVYMPDDIATTKTYEDVINAIDNKGLSITKPVMGEQFTVGGGVFTILGPQKKYSDHNNNSIVLKMNYGDVSFMFTGDAEAEAEGDIIDKGYDLKADVLKVGHHGSSTSTSDSWLSVVSPRYAVIQTETGNDYGHPHKETIDKLNEKEIQIFRNDTMGEFVMVSDGKNISVTTSDGKSYESTTSNANTTTNNSTTNNTTTENTQNNINNINNTVSTDNTKKETYIGNVNSKKFHKESCSSLPAESNRVYFESREEALSNCYEPCGNCNP